MIKLVNKYSLLSVTRFWHHTYLFYNNGIYCWRQTFASANIDNVVGLVRSQEGKPRTNSGKVCGLQHISDFCQEDIKYDLQLKCILVHCGHPLPGGHLIVLVLLFFSIRVFSPINIPSFLRKLITQACSSITIAVTYLSQMVHPNIVGEIHMMLQLCYWYQRIFIHQFNNSYILHW